VNDLGFGTADVVVNWLGDTITLARWVNDDRHSWISDRQLQCLELLLRHDRKTAAARLGIAQSTVRNHLNRLYASLGVSSASQAAIVLGWLRLPDAGVDVAPWWIATA
jgi:DNA-binding CsgD family transcriptional regulator